MGHPYHYAYDSHGSRLRFSFKRATMVVCGSNIVVVLYMLHSLLVPLYLPASSRSSIVLIRQNGTLMPTVMRYTAAQLNLIKEANKARQAAQPLKLIERVKELQQESGVLAVNASIMNSAARQHAASELAHRLNGKLYNPNNHQGLNDWRKKKLKLITKKEVAVVTVQERGQDKEEVQFAEELALEEASSLSVEEEQSGLHSSAAEIEDDIIPGRSVPEECQAEGHTDYDGVAVRWGLTHHVESAVDCCQACLDHARNAEGDSKKCNVWVYCPLEEGCYSPDIYEHKHHECWLKQADEPKLNFKMRYDEEYRTDHPNAPLIVPWVSGIIRS